MKMLRLLFAFVLLIIAAEFAQAQSYQPNVITTAVPFLTYSPDARATAMGECGVATDADAFSMFYNPAKYAFMKNEHTMIASGINLWPGLFNINFPLHMYGVFAQKIGKSVIATTARYYDYGNMELFDQYHQSFGFCRPWEFAVDVSYSYRFGDYFSVGAAGRFVYYKLYSGQKSYSIAGDVSAYYNRPLGNVVNLSLGTSITNIGTKMSHYYPYPYNKKIFIPTTFRIGSGLEFVFHPKHSLAMNVQFSKLLVPSAPIRDGQTGEIIYGRDDDVSVLRGMVQSFYDAPGWAYDYSADQWSHIGTFYEELCEINTGIGLEYNLADHFYARSGFFNEPTLKGGRKYVTLGAGMHFGIFSMDMSYTIPVGNVYVTNSSGNVFRWDMYFAF